MPAWFEVDDEPDATPERVAEWESVLAAFQGKLGGRNRGRPWIRAACPMCQELEGRPDHKESLGLQPLSGKYRCFKCEAWGWLPISFRSQLTDDADVDFMPAAPEPVKEPPQRADGFTRLFEEPGQSALAFEWARRYVLEPRPSGRGLRLETARAAQLGAALYGPGARRVIIPLPDYADAGGAWRGWVGRAVGPSDLPYRYAKNFDRNGYLYNEPALYVDTRDPVYVVEGAFDALALWPDAVAVMGKPLESQMPLLLRAKRPIAVLLDGDIWDACQALAWTLQHKSKMAVAVRLPPKVDPDELPRAAIDQLYQRALAAS